MSDDYIDLTLASVELEQLAEDLIVDIFRLGFDQARTAWQARDEILAVSGIDEDTGAVVIDLAHGGSSIRLEFHARIRFRITPPATPIDRPAP